MSEHDLFCDCLDCMGGVPFSGAGVVHSDPAPTTMRPRKRHWGDVIVPGYSSQTPEGIRLEQAAKVRERRAV